MYMVVRFYVMGSMMIRRDKIKIFEEGFQYLIPPTLFSVVILRIQTLGTKS